MSPPFSIVTVTLNAARTLQATLDSLRQQTWQDYEYVIVDGGSTDDTLAIAAEYRDNVDVLISEKDAGIYDAMNKAVALVRGRYVFFLNADDRLAKPDVLAAVHNELSAHPATQLLYGNVLYDYGTRRERRRFGWVTRKNLLYGNLCHQAVFASRDLFARVGLFDLRFSVASDYDWLMKVMNSGVVVRYLDKDIAVFCASGTHARDPERLHREKRRIQASYAGALRFALGNTLFRLRRRIGLLKGIHGEPI